MRKPPPRSLIVAAQRGPVQTPPPDELCGGANPWRPGRPMVAMKIPTMPENSSSRLTDTTGVGWG